MSYIVQTVLRDRRPELELLGRDVSRLEDRAALPAHPLRRCAGHDQQGGEAGERVPPNDEPRPPWSGATTLARRTRPMAAQFDRRCSCTTIPPRPRPLHGRGRIARRCRSADLLAPEGYGEIIIGGERSSDLATLSARSSATGLPREAYEWYLDLRRFGSVPHSGFGLGIERR